MFGGQRFVFSSEGRHRIIPNGGSPSNQSTRRASVSRSEIGNDRRRVSSGSPNVSLNRRRSSMPSLAPSNSTPANVADSSPTPDFNFRHTYTLREMHNQPIFGISFNEVNRCCSTDPLLFCTTAGHYVTIYQCNIRLSDESNHSTSTSTCQATPSIVHTSPSTDSVPPIVLLQSFADPVGDDEEFYCTAWSRDTTANTVPPKMWLDQCKERVRESEPNELARSFNSVQLPPHQQIVAAAGKRGVIRILCPSLASCPFSLVGHGSAVNELKFHPRDPALLFSFSKDYTARLWNVSTQVLVAIFGGVEGHRAEVLHGDVSLTGELLVTASMDHCIKIWRLNTSDFANAVVASFVKRDAKKNGVTCPILVENFPEFSSRDLHGNYVDCVRWFGSLIISKSCENRVTLWKPGSLDDSPSKQGASTTAASSTQVGNIRLPARLKPVEAGPMFADRPRPPPRAVAGVPTEHKACIIHQLKVPDCSLWYIRFDVDLVNQVLALGTGTGPTRVFLWDLSQPEQAFKLTAQTLQAPAVSGHGLGGISLAHSAIRQTRFANAGKTLICVGDNGLIIRFDRP